MIQIYTVIYNNGIDMLKGGEEGGWGYGGGVGVGLGLGVGVSVGGWWRHFKNKGWLRKQNTVMRPPHSYEVPLLIN